MGSNIAVMEGGTVLDMLTDIDNGNLVLDLEEISKMVVQASMETMKKGSITLKIDFDPDPKSEAIRISASLKHVAPVKPRKARLYFANEDGTITRSNPRQHDMFVERVDPRTGVVHSGND